MEYNKRKIILDVDTGTDDATAIILAALSDKVDLIGITTVWGNKPLPLTTRHTLMVVDLLKKEIPVYAGCPGPMARNLYKTYRPDFSNEPIVFDEQGKQITFHEDFNLPEPARKAEKKHAVQYIIDTCRESDEKITLVGVGPATNLGVALSIAPDIVDNIEEIILMGGSIETINITACADANVFNDPEASRIVLESGAKVLYVSLDATSRAALPKEYIAKCREAGNPVGDFFAEILCQRIRTYNALQPLWRPDIAPIHDALCIAYLIDPAVLTDIRHMHITICLDHDVCAGAFLIDTRHYHEPLNAYLAYDADQERFGGIILDALRKF